MDNRYVSCACGCGQKFLKYHPIYKTRNPARKYVYGHNMKNRKQNSLHIINRIKSFKNGGYVAHRQSQEIRNKISSSLKSRPKSPQMIDRLTQYTKARGKVAFKYGYFYSDKNQRKMFYRSSYELQAFKILEQMSMVVKYAYEPFSISYFVEGEKYIYHPDLLVIYKDGSKQVVEIKPKKELDDIVNIKKFESAKDFCQNKNLNFDVWTEDILFNDEPLGAFMKKVANSEKPLSSDEVTPNQAERFFSPACVETNGQPPKGMI